MLVLSLFPGIGLLDMAFEQEGFCIVRGPDALWGGDIKRFHPPSGIFAGIIGGPPCQPHSRYAGINRRIGNKIAECLIMCSQPESPPASRVRPRWISQEKTSRQRSLSATET